MGRKADRDGVTDEAAMAIAEAHPPTSIPLARERAARQVEGVMAFEELADAVPAERQAPQHVEMEWALRNSLTELRLGVVDPETVPSRVALRLARLASSSDENFWAMYQRILPTKQQIDRAASAEESALSDADLLDRLPKPVNLEAA